MLQCGVFSLEVLGTGGLGTFPSIVAASDNDRLLFECGDGTQRLCTENGVRISKVSRIYLSSNSPRSNGGLGGFLLTRSDLASGEKTEVFGPPGTAGIVRSFRYFYQRPTRLVSVYEAGSSQYVPSTKDGITVQPILIGGPSNRVTSEVGSAQKRNRHDKPADIGRGFELFESQLPVCAEGDLDYIASYVLTLPAKRGKFHRERAISLGVQPGKDFGRLTRGETVTLASGRIVLPEECMDETGTSSIALILNCPSISHFTELSRNPVLQDLVRHSNKQIKCIVHMTSADVICNSRYEEWCRDFGIEGQHLFLGHGISPERHLFRASTQLHCRLSCLHRKAFPLIAPSEAVTPLRSESKNFMAVDSKAKFVILPVRCEGLTLARVSDDIDVDNEINEARNLLGWRLRSCESADEVSNGEASGLNVLFLGTGSAIPSKYRNVSAFLVSGYVDHSKAMIIDCGEGTVGQLARSYGSVTRAHEVIKEAAFVWISHMHADHHLGLLNVLAVRADISAEYPLIVAGPSQLNNFLTEFGQALGGREGTAFLRSFTFLDNETMTAERQSNFEPPALRQLKMNGELSRTFSVPVLHCYKAYGLVLESQQGWKLVYSGDTEYCPALVSAGKGATVLIHEATFEDGKEADAADKKHSTVTQAGKAGVEMDAKTVIFTHFSQRYPKNPPLPVSASSRPMVFAFDLMHFKPEFAPSLAACSEDFDALLESQSNDEVDQDASIEGNHDKSTFE